MAGSRVDLYIYDLTAGLATILSSAILGRQIDGVWHTAIVVFEREYFFGSSGIQACEVEGTPLGRPREKITLGETFIPYSLFREYIEGLSSTTFHGSTYHLLKHNCNTFSNELANFLCGASIPKYILDLPNTVLDTPIGRAFAGAESSINTALSLGNIPERESSQTSQTLAGKEKKKKKKERKLKKRDFR